MMFENYDSLWQWYAAIFTASSGVLFVRQAMRVTRLEIKVDENFEKLRAENKEIKAQVNFVYETLRQNEVKADSRHHQVMGHLRLQNTRYEDLLAALQKMANKKGAP